MPRKKTQAVKVGRLKIGGHHPIAVQSMTNTDTKDVEKTMAQIRRLENAGCEIIRMSVYDEECAKAVAKIKQSTQTPLVADIHFDYRLAILSMENGVDKVRINPGNIGSRGRVKAVVDCAKSHHVPLRIGANAGSLSKDMVSKHGRSAKAMVESVREQIELLESMNFYDIVVSLKASDVKKTVEACTLFASEYDYPQHIGVTEAGSGRSGLIKSSIGIGTLLQRGIGDTFRVSLSGDPVEEVYAAWDILRAVGLRRRGIEIISCPTCARCGVDVEHLANQINEQYKDVDTPLKVAVMGCAVNGPGEASEADIGIAGGGEYSLIFKQ
ncbi:MAG: flavodoxin-dependent (E)-4-hydroxy-3-methylbut-2-enyl-diphosphate synthase, partial [Proteobacteria bacterium]|nr:flavodoxin-dependent (E)-4-hydroxy-3-methylbut-2-enyl-diphosphate synthase [Pseudomonadota bacterium]